MSKRHKDHQKIGDVIASFVQNSKLEKGLDIVRIERAWQLRMGNGIQNYTNCLKLHNGTLYVSLSSSVLRQELSYGKDKIIAIINEELGKKLVTKLILR